MIKIKLVKKEENRREYLFSHRKDRRFSWRNKVIVFKTVSNMWEFTSIGGWIHLNREDVLAIESILRGLNS